MSKPIVLFFCPQMKSIADDIVRKHPDDIKFKSIAWGNFADGWPDYKILIDGENELRGRDIAFLASFANLADSVAQRWVMNAFRAYQARSLTILLPFFPTGTMERKDKQGRIVTAKSLARDLSGIPQCLGLANRLVILDIHALSEWHIFEGLSVVPILTSAIPLLKTKFFTLSDFRDISVVFPDDGAQKRFGDQFTGLRQIICEKKRSGEHRSINIIEGDPRGRHCVIVDDLALTCNTQLECGRMMLNNGASKVSMYVTHLVAPQGSWKRICDADFPIEHFWTTDSCPWTLDQMLGVRHSPIEVLPLIDVLAEQILAVREYFFDSSVV